MKISRILLAAFFSAWLAGCIPATQNTNSQNLSNSQINENLNEQVYPSITECPLTTKNVHAPKKSAKSLFNVFNSANTINKTPPPHLKCPSQEDIDQALGLCDSAQNFWEKGELENALIELDTAYSIILKLDLDEYPDLNQQKEDLRFMISKRILEIYASRHIIVNGNHNAIPITLNQHVKKEIESLTGPEKNFLLRAMSRSGKYRPYIVSELKKAGMPEELSWLPLIESGFKINALSPARALGLWQFIPSTGYKFGLIRNYYVDERLDPVKSTKAAISYLSELHKIFGDWSTVLAAYNCGEGRVLKIIRNQKINYLDNFWDLYQKLPRETARYVPRFLATVHIMNNLSKYDITPLDSLKPIEYKTFTINKQIRLADLAAQIKVSQSRLKELNPELRYNLLPPEEYNIRIPVDKADIFMESLDKTNPSFPTPTRYVYHRVKKGDTLSCIADRYNCNINTIARANKISKRKVLHIGQVLKIPAKKSSSAYAKVNTRKRSTGKKNTAKKNPITYTVKRGDNLWLIARKYGTTTKAIFAANNLKSAELNIKQELTIPRTSANKKITPKKTSYWVKSGDSPFTIAQKYNMTLQRLLTLNHLTKRSKIYPGQKLVVE